MYIIEIVTPTEKICESFPTYEEARRRVEQFPADSLVSLPLIFKKLEDDSQRLVRDDEKPLHWHRLEQDELPPHSNEPIPLTDVVIEGDVSEVWMKADQENPQDEEPPLPWPDSLDPEQKSKNKSEL